MITNLTSVEGKAALKIEGVRLEKALQHVSLEQMFNTLRQGLVARNVADIHYSPLSHSLLVTFNMSEGWVEANLADIKKELTHWALSLVL